MVCIDYTSQLISVGDLNWLVIDFGENLPLGDKLRMALSEGGKIERNQRVVLHLAAAYEWVLQGWPRRPPSLSRIQTSGAQLRQAEFQQASGCMSVSHGPTSVREFEVASSAHDVLSEHHDRSFEDPDLFFNASFNVPMMPLVVLELNLATQPPRSRALVFSNDMDFSLERVLVLGVWNNHTRLLIPSAETTPATWRGWQNVVDSVAPKGWDGWRGVNPLMTPAQCRYWGRSSHAIGVSGYRLGAHPGVRG